MSDIENLRDTVTPKSDQLNADDLAGTTKVYRVTAVKRGTTKEQPVIIEYAGMECRPYKPCKSMRRVLIAAWGEDGREWAGRSMKLYCDPEVLAGGFAGLCAEYPDSIPDAGRVMTHATVAHAVLRSAGKLVQPAVYLLEWCAEFQKRFTAMVFISGHRDTS